MESANAISRIDAVLGARLASGERLERKIDEMSKDLGNQRDTINALSYAVEALKVKLPKP